MGHRSEHRNAEPPRGFDRRRPREAGNIARRRLSDARIVVDQRDSALLVPTSALFRRGADWAVYRIVDGRARLSNVRLGPP
jgi:hypothetical protein